MMTESTMSPEQYVRALATVGLKPSANMTAKALGISKRQLLRYAAGSPVPRTVELLLDCYRSMPEPLWFRQ